MITKLFSKNGISFEYATLKDGSFYHIAFPGFGRDLRDYEMFTSILKPDDGLIGVNLFFHGKSKVPPHYLRHGLPLQDFYDAWTAFLIHLKIDTYGLIGYSLGGKICLTLLEKFPGQITSVLLLAPDGLYLNPLYKFAIGTILGKWLFHFVNKHPSFLFKTTDVLKSLKILSPKLHRFVYVHMDTKQKRDQVFNVWMTYRWFRPDQDVLVSNIKKYHIRFTMIFGKYDSIIRPSLGKKFSAKLGDVSVFHQLNIGHQILQESTISYISDNGIL